MGVRVVGWIAPKLSAPNFTPTISAPKDTWGTNFFST